MRVIETHLRENRPLRKLRKLHILKGWMETLRTHVTLRLISHVHPLHTLELDSVQTVSKHTIRVHFEDKRKLGYFTANAW